LHRLDLIYSRFIPACRQYLLRACSAGEVFDFFQLPGLATRWHRHHCLAALQGDKGFRFAARVPVSPIECFRMYKLYSMQRSGNSYKVRLALALLNAPYRSIEIDILRGESRTPDFLAMNPSGQVPLLEVAEGRYLAESNAILWYVAGGTSLAPETRIERAEALQWMFFEQHALEPNIGAAYFWLSLVRGGRDLQTHALEDWMERGYAALQVMENHLKTHEYFATGQLTVADIALYGYTHVADRCDYDLATFPAIRSWLRRVEQTRGFVAMDWRPDAEVDEAAGIAAEA
jgi:glutathione S-transferase